MDQCDEAQIPVMVKQANIGWKLVKMPEIDGRVRDALPWRSNSREVGE